MDHLTAQERQLYGLITSLLSQTDKLDTVAKGSVDALPKKSALQLSKPALPPKQTKRQARVLSMLATITALLVRRHGELVLPSTGGTHSLLAIDGRQHLGPVPSDMLQIVESSAALRFDPQTKNNAWLLQVVVEEGPSLHHHARHLLGLLQGWHQAQEPDQAGARLRLQDHITFSSRDKILEKFVPRQKDKDVSGFFELLTVTEDVFKEGRGQTPWPKQLWGHQVDVLLRLCRQFSLDFEADEFYDEIYGKYIQRTTFHACMRGALMGSFEGMTKLVQRTKEIQAASK